MIDTTRMPVKETETSLASDGRSHYTSKLVYESAYFRITILYSESGSELKRTEQKLD